MRKLKLFFACLLMAVLSIGQVWGAETLVYTLDGTTTGGSNGYATESEITQGGKTWQVTGNTTENPWRLGGNSISGINRPVYCTSTFSENITKVVLSHGTNNGVTVNSVKLIVASNSDFSTIISETTRDNKTSDTIIFNRPSDKDWTGRYFKIVYNMTKSGSGNKYQQFIYAKFYAEESSDVIVKTLKSIAVTGQTTTYDQFASFSFDGTCTATYSVTKNDVPQADEQKEVTPTSVSSPDMTTTGEKEVTVSYTEGGVTKTAKYNITVNEHTVTPGKYTLTLANALWGTSYTSSQTSTSANALDLNGSSNDIQLTLTNGTSTSMYITDEQTRAYSGYTLTFSVPTGYNITKIEFTKASKWGLLCASGLNADADTWTGEANSVEFTFSARTDLTSVDVTYEEVDNTIVKTLKSIAVTGMTTSYEVGDAFSFDGTCTATYTVTQGGAAQPDENKTVTPTSVSSPNMSTTGEKTVTVTYEENAVSKTVDYTINVNPHTITPGEYAVLLNNVLWGVEAGQQAASVESMEGSSHDVNFATTKGTSQMYASATQTRFYTDATLTISAPTGYNITSIVFAEPSADKKWDGSISVDEGTYTADTKTWAGEANTVVFTFGAQNRIATATVTYAVAASYEVTLATCTNGSVGATAASTISSGDEVLSGTTITLSSTPTSGYQLVAYDVYKTGEPTTKVTVKETAGVYTFKMPAYAVTISATFSEILILDDITLSGEYQTTFWQGVPFNSNNLVVTASYTNAADAVVTPTSITDPDMSTPGVKTITVSYTEGTITKEKSYNITVKAVPSTQENPYTVAEARSLYDAYNAASIAQPTVYVKGVVTSASMETGGSAPAAYKNKAYNVYVKDAGTDGTITFEFYRMLDGRGAGDPAAFTNGDITTGDTLIAVGTLSKYSSTYEFSAGCNLKVRKAYTAPKVDISNTKETAYTVAHSIELIDDLSSDLTSVVFVKGVVTEVDGSNIFIKDAGTDGSVTFEFYNCQDVTGVDENDTIIGTGTFKKHNSIYELNTGCEVVEIKNYVEPVIAVTGVSLNHDVLNLTAGQKVTLIATIEPDNASNTDVAWESDKPGIASVVNGLVTAVSEGTAVITVTTDDGGYTATCTVNVAPHTVVPGTYSITFNNAFWGTSYTGTDAAAEDELQGSQDDITIHHTKSGSNLYVNNSETRVYGDHTMEISVPTGYVITEMAFTKGTKWDISDVSKGSFTEGTWSGEANSVTITFGNRTDLTTVSITYAAATPPTPVYEIVRSGLEAGRHYTICLKKKIIAVKGATFWNLNKRDEGATVAYLEEAELPFPAGTPYIFQATNDNEGKLEVVYEGGDVENPVTNGALRGRFTDLDQAGIDDEATAEGSDIYMLKNNELRQANGRSGNTMGAYKAYIVYGDLTPVSTSPIPAPGKRVKSMPMEPQVTTDVENINASEQPVKMMIDGQLFILRGEKLYDATGRLVK